MTDPEGRLGSESPSSRSALAGTDGPPASPTDDALDLAGRALARRDLSRSELERRLLAAGIDPQDAARTVARLAGAGLVDDVRLARSRAARLAARGLGDAVIEARLAGEGIGEAERGEALAALEPEEERARRLAGTAGSGAAPRLAATLYRRGFAQSAVEAALAALDAPDGAKLR
jgi:regulatory protein